jgi:nucleoside-diphosphate-sugar epimerase
MKQDSMIVRSADFYGPNATLSMTHSTVTEKLKAKKTAQWLGDPQATHTFTYTPDAGRTLAAFGNTPTAYGQTWHVLTSKEPMSGEQYIRMACDLMGQPYNVQAMGKMSVRFLGLFVPVLREFVEMMYQFDSNYRFDSSKAEQALGTIATGYKEGIAATMKA